MADNKSELERSRNMATVKSRNTQPELLLRKALWREGLRFFTASGWTKLSGTKLPGTPDLVFPSARLTVFVDGCFWHGCPDHYSEPDANRLFWRSKLIQNYERDFTANQELESLGWQVLRLWEHQVRKRNLPRVVAEITRFVRQADAQE